MSSSDDECTCGARKEERPLYVVSMYAGNKVAQKDMDRFNWTIYKNKVSKGKAVKIATAAKQILASPSSDEEDSKDNSMPTKKPNESKHGDAKPVHIKHECGSQASPAVSAGAVGNSKIGSDMSLPSLANSDEDFTMGEIKKTVKRKRGGSTDVFRSKDDNAEATRSSVNTKRSHSSKLLVPKHSDEESQ
ncbi:hypothetical protein IE81DRAFT_326175 [Ceraceosorus guamensis]|uniref:Uncharacterized protein n=1 Tax=Ceraceosorus guamensis TaxID=1522189 RepID=A0A316VWH4_9BASI|nr:hypothetical protein IE81DRAFT_326175 [Ceraceosorus guamensis]PWN39805.1 hypothetical protein IE81DRAFT_326175 [Ceraceosorus guamensis]